MGPHIYIRYMDRFPWFDFRTRQEEVSLRFMAPQSPAVHGTPSKRSVDILGVYYHNIPIMSGPISTTMIIWDINHNDSAQIIARTAEATRQVAGISEVSP